MYDIAETSWTRKAFRSFADRHIGPVARHNDETGVLSADAVDALAGSGYLSPFLPEEHGGVGLAMPVVMDLHEEIGRGCAALRSLLTVHGMASRAVQRFGSDEQKVQWLPRLATGEEIGAFCLSEPGAGSNPAEMATEAVAVDDGWRLDGTKTWITVGQLATVFLVFARTGTGYSCFFVPRTATGLTVSPIAGLEAVRGSMLARLEFDGCFVPRSALLGRKGFGFPIIATDVLTFGRLSVAAGSIGAMQDCLERSLAHAHSREQYGVPLIQHELVAEKLSNMIVSLDAARMLLARAAEQTDADAPDAVMQACIAKQFAARAAAQVATDAVQIHGARGVFPEAGVFRHYRDARVAEIIEGSTEILSSLLATEASAMPAAAADDPSDGGYDNG